MARRGSITCSSPPRQPIHQPLELLDAAALLGRAANGSSIRSTGLAAAGAGGAARTTAGADTAGAGFEAPGGLPSFFAGGASGAPSWIFLSACFWCAMSVGVTSMSFCLHSSEPVICAASSALVRFGCTESLTGSAVISDYPFRLLRISMKIERLRQSYLRDQPSQVSSSRKRSHCIPECMGYAGRNSDSTPERRSTAPRYSINDKNPRWIPGASCFEFDRLDENRLRILFRYDPRPAIHGGRSTYRCRPPRRSTGAAAFRAVRRA